LVGPRFLYLDLPGRGHLPSAWRWIIGTIVAIALSLAACGALVVVAVHLFPATAGYGHFQFSDYSKLTIIGVFVACLGWPFVAWFTSRARWLYLWLGILATVVSLAPDLWILHLGQPAAGVATLAVMHVALGIVTYLAMVLIAPQRSTQASTAGAHG
jgi:hypothetical protein